MKVVLGDDIGVLEGRYELAKLCLLPLLVFLFSLCEQALRQPCEALVFEIAFFHVNFMN